MPDFHDYLCVDQFLEGPVEAQAISLALDSGLISQLEQGHVARQEIIEQYSDEIQSVGALLDVLIENNVFENRDEGLKLSTSFQHALQYQDLIEEKIRFGNIINTDFIEHGSRFFSNISEFMQVSNTFRLFDYSRAIDLTPENYQATEDWVKYTTILTRYESAACLQQHDFSEYHSLLDIGGNSGEFSLQICRQNAELEATVVDLPVVCEVGAAHVKDTDEVSRISFIPTNIIEEDLPHGFDIVTIKSLLHDWPEEYVPVFLEKAIHSLLPGGTLLIFERVHTPIQKKYLSFSMLPILAFHRFYRSPELYVEHLQRLGMVDIELQIIELDMQCVLLTARKPG